VTRDLASNDPRIVPEIFERYAEAHSAPPSLLAREVEAATVANGVDPRTMVGPVEGALLAMLVRLTGARRVLEIGLSSGYSALAMAEALPPDGEIISCEIDQGVAALAQSLLARSEHGRKVAVKVGPALETIAALPPEPSFGLVFLDADKENYLAYYQAVVPLLRPGGLLVADNVLLGGAVILPRHPKARAMAAFNRAVCSDPRVESVMLTVRDGITLARRLGRERSNG
jgi:caffeoyl-CoA O-methyltransferase